MAHDTGNLLESMFEYGMDLRRRRVFLQGGLEPRKPEEDAPGVEVVIRALLYLDKTQGPIELWINSEGGDLVEMFALYDVIRTLDNDVETIGFGQVASSAGLILAAGKSRYATPNCWFMSHGMHVETGGGLYESAARMELYQRMEKRWATLMGKHTKHPSSWWRRLHDGKRRELWLDSKQMLEHGIIDEVWPPEDDDS